MAKADSIRGRCVNEFMKGLLMLLESGNHSDVKVRTINREYDVSFTVSIPLCNLVLRIIFRYEIIRSQRGRRAGRPFRLFRKSGPAPGIRVRWPPTFLVDEEVARTSVTARRCLKFSRAAHAPDPSESRRG